MTLSIALLSLALVFSVSSTWACEANLKSSPHQLAPASIRLAPPDQALKLFMNHGPVIAVPRGGGRAWTVIFDPSPAHKNRGWVVEGRREGGVFVAQRARASDLSEERNFFRRVVALHEVTAQRFPVHNPRIQADEVIISEMISVKLLLKHDLTAQDVQAVLESEDAKITFAYEAGDRSYHVRGYDGRGRLVVAVLDSRADGPDVLITAFIEK